VGVSVGCGVEVGVAPASEQAKRKSVNAITSKKILAVV
jgi:hypothetical protein